MLDKLSELNALIGKTPVAQLEHDKLNLFAKLEFFNFTGSVKVRPAFYILSEAIRRGEINRNSTVIESSSGNFGVALAMICKKLGLSFIPVIDPNINTLYETFLRSASTRVEKVQQPDESGGFLLTRIKKVHELLETHEDAYWTNQYGNIDSMLAHYYGTGQELADHFDQLDYAFIGVSSGGTISGISRRLKEKFPNIVIAAVDSEGSVIFGGGSKKRYIPGIGSSMVPDILKNALIDEVIHVPEHQAVNGCLELLHKHAFFVGGSSGSSYAAIQEYFQDKTFIRKPNVVFLCPDSGFPYLETVFNEEWVKQVFPEKSQVLV